MPGKDFWGGLLQGFAGPFSEGLLARTRSQQRRLEEELAALNAQMQQQTEPEWRDAYIAAIYKLGQSGKPGVGYKEVAKRIAALGGAKGAPPPSNLIFNQAAMDRATAPLFDVTGPSGPVGAAGPPAGPGEQSFLPAQAAAVAASPTAPIAAALPAEVTSAALPSTSPTAATGSSAGQGGPPSEEEMLQYGQSIGMKAPTRLPEPQRPPGPQTKGMQEQYKTESTNWRNSEDVYTSHINRLSTLVAEERRRIATQKAAEAEKLADKTFRTKEREATQTFTAGQNVEQRTTTLKAAGIRAGGDASKEEAEQRKAKQKDEDKFFAEMASITEQAAKYSAGKGGLRPEMVEPMRAEARARYEAAIGEKAPEFKTAELPARGAAKGGPPAEPAAKLPTSLRQTFDQRRRLLGLAAACNELLAEPKLHQVYKDAARVEFRCP